MFDEFLNDLLKIVVVLNILGVVAYFLLGALRPKVTEAAGAGATALADPLHRGETSLTGEVGLDNLFSHNQKTDKGNRDSSLWGRVAKKLKPAHKPSRPAYTPASMDGAFADLRRVLNSYREGLA